MEELIVLIFLNLLMLYSLFRLFFCFIKVFKKKEIKKFLWGDLVFGIVYLLLCIKILGKDFFSQNQGLHVIVCILVVLLFMIMKRKNIKFLSYVVFSLVFTDLLGLIYHRNMQFYGIIVLQIPIFIIANFVKDDNRLNKYTYSTLIMANLLNISAISLKTLMLLEKTGKI
ncbi:signal transduction histidine kinase [Leptotrichia trevisanii]|uniref:Signal transduction histidine kinase n=2 Tax=Leptotrichia trevisanii TaxID=109328 RepID=A0A510K2X5_9FUSO|nr:signal transduction histidine kinase [Leptotrichia trevisanii]